MSMRCNLAPDLEGDTDQHLSWRVWLLLPLLLISLAGIAVPFMKRSQTLFSTHPRLEQERPDRVVYEGELAPLLTRPDIDSITRSVLAGLHTRLLQQMDQQGSITPTDRRRVDRFLRDYR